MSTVPIYCARYGYPTKYNQHTRSYERVHSVGAQQVVFKVRGDDQGSKRWVRLNGVEFVRRFVLHEVRLQKIGNAPQTTVQRGCACVQAARISQGSRPASAYLETLPSHRAHFAFTKTLKHTP